jgi:hypothetical protein
VNILSELDPAWVRTKEGIPRRAATMRRWSILLNGLMRTETQRWLMHIRVMIKSNRCYDVMQLTFCPLVHWLCKAHSPGFAPSSGHVEFVVDKVALRQVFSENFGFPCQFLFHRLLHTHHLSSGAGTIGQLVGDIPSGLSLTPPQEKKSTFSYHLYVLSCSQASLIQLVSEILCSSLFYLCSHKLQEHF